MLEARIAPAFGTVFELSTLDGSSGFKLSGEAGNAHSGVSVSGLGDVNGDGIEDLIVGANRPDPNGVHAGASYVVFGKAGGFPEDFELSTLNGSNGFKLNGVTTSHYFERRSARAGDLNGDGFGDLLIGAAGDDTNGAAAGAAYVVFGHGGSFSPVLELSNLAGANGFQIHGEASYDLLGSGLSTAGDVNGDGFDDVVIGARWADPRGRDSGASYVIFGHREAFAATLDLSTLDGSNGFRINGEVADSYAGLEVSSGDVNGDGFDDLLIGALDTSRQRPEDAAGTVYVVFGHEGSFSRKIELSKLDGDTGFQIFGPRTYDKENDVAVSSGDINGDGFDDVLFGTGKSRGGVVYVIRGRAEGFPAELRIANGHGRVNSAYGVQISGDFLSHTNLALNATGDINGDGFDDVLIGQHQAPASVYGTPFGAAYVVYGSGSALQSNVDLSKLNGRNGFKLLGGAGDETGFDVSSGDFNRDGFSDLLIGAPRAGLSGESYVVFGPITGLDSKTATFTDVDGDRVTVTTSRWRFAPSNFTISPVPGAVAGGGQFSELNVSKQTVLEKEFTGADITITAHPTALGGDGKVNLGYLNATGADLGNFRLHGDLGQVDAGDRGFFPNGPAFRLLKVHSLGAEGITTQDPAAPSLNSSFVGNLKKLRVKGDVIGGVTLAVDGRIGIAVIGGTLDHSSVTALGLLAPSNKTQAVAIQSLSIGGNVAASRILAGYDPAGMPVNPGASIGKIRVSGTWTASDLVAGVADATGDGFGRNDALIAGDTTPELLSRIASITIIGAATGTDAAGDHFGITAQQIRRVIAGSNRPAFAAGPDDVLLDPVNSDFRVVDFA